MESVPYFISNQEKEEAVNDIFRRLGYVVEEICISQPFKELKQIRLNKRASDELKDELRNKSITLH